MTLLHTVLAFLAALGSLVIIHELGHYWVARWCGVKVLRFSVGMGKVIFSRKIGPDQTEWVVSALPLGGYVKMLDVRENPDVVLTPEERKREFTNQSVWRRMAIVAAGPAANFLLAILLFAALFMHGLPEPVARLRAPDQGSAAYSAGVRSGDLVTSVNGEPIQIWSDLRWKLIRLIIEKRPARLDLERAGETVRDGKDLRTVTVSLNSLTTEDLDSDFVAKLGLGLYGTKVTITGVDAGGAASRAGVLPGDRILRIDGQPLADANSLIKTVEASPGRPITLRVLRAGREVDVLVTPATILKAGKATGRLQVALGIASDVQVVDARATPGDAVVKAVARTWDSGALQLKIIGKILTGGASVKNITGPITIADYAGKTAQMGWIAYLQFIAAISIGLGIMNLLPIPVLDGGLLLYYSLEVFTGRPVSERIGQLGQRLGIGLLMTLMAIAVFNDVVRLIS